MNATRFDTLTVNPLQTFKGPSYEHDRPFENRFYRYLFA